MIFIKRTKKVIAEKKALDLADQAAFEIETSLSRESSVRESGGDETLYVPGALEFPAAMRKERRSSDGLSPRVEERKLEEEKSKRAEVENIRNKLNRRNSHAVNTGLPILMMGDVIEQKKKKVEKVVKDGVTVATEKIEYVGKGIAQGVSNTMEKGIVGKVRIVPSNFVAERRRSFDEKQKQAAEAKGIEMSSSSPGDEAFRVPKVSKQGEHEQHLLTPPGTDSGMV